MHTFEKTDVIRGHTKGFIVKCKHPGCAYKASLAYSDENVELANVYMNFHLNRVPESERGWPLPRL